MIVCGLHSVGLRIVEQLNLSGVPAVVVDDHGRHSGQVELLDDAQPDTVQAAHDHVPPPVRVSARHLGIVFSLDDRDVSGAYAGG